MCVKSVIKKVNFLNEGSEPKFLERRETVKS